MYSINPEEHLHSRGIVDLNKSSNIEIKQSESNVELTKINLEHEEREWRSCCFNLHKESLLF